MPCSLIGRPPKLYKHSDQERRKSVHIMMDDIKILFSNYVVNKL